MILAFVVFSLEATAYVTEQKVYRPVAIESGVVLTSLGDIHNYVSQEEEDEQCDSFINSFLKEALKKNWRAYYRIEDNTLYTERSFHNLLQEDSELLKKIRSGNAKEEQQSGYTIFWPKSVVTRQNGCFPFCMAASASYQFSPEHTSFENAPFHSVYWMGAKTVHKIYADLKENLHQIDIKSLDPRLIAIGRLDRYQVFSEQDDAIKQSLRGYETYIRRKIADSRLSYKEKRFVKKQIAVWKKLSDVSAENKAILARRFGKERATELIVDNFASFGVECLIMVDVLEFIKDASKDRIKKRLWIGHFGRMHLNRVFGVLADAGYLVEINLPTELTSLPEVFLSF